jgi:3-methyl-2-oxobutanoate hydroxymethyltransferase
VNLWGRDAEGDVSLDEIALVCGAVRRGVARALVSCDLPPGGGVDGARRLVDRAGADIVKAEGSALVEELVGAGIPVFAQLDAGRTDGETTVGEARRLEALGAALLDVRGAGPDVGPKIVAALSIPVLGGLGGGPWLDGRIRMIHRAIGYGATTDGAYADVAQVVEGAIRAYAEDVRSGRQVRGG